MTGRPRLAHVKRELKKCETHGLTEFATKLAGLGQSPVQYCMACDNDRSKKRSADIKAGVHIPGKRAPEPKKLNICPDCKMEKPATNICDYC